jgi:NAD+ kinase
MTMPIDLLLVRHGKSEGNLAQERARAGDTNGFTQEFRERRSSQFRLTTIGIEQAKAAGNWLKAKELGHFDRYYASEYIRAFETAGHLALDLLAEERWYLDFFLRERDNGLFDVMPYAEREEKFAEYHHGMKRDRFFGAPPGGESMADVALRLGRLLDTLNRECFDQRVIVVCHGETMWAMRVRLERIPAKKYDALRDSEHPHDRINNCQILHYTRRNPVSGAMARRYDWMRSICPWDESLSSNVWKPIVRPTFTNQELLAMADSEKRLIDDV